MHAGAHTDSATAQRLAVNTCLKSIVWTTACATKAAGVGLPALDVDVSLHVLAPDAAPIAIDAGRGDRPDWLAFWLVAGGPLSVAYADGVLDAATGDDAGDMLVGGMTPGIASQMGCAVLGGRDRFRTSTERVVAELRVHRLAHAHG